MWGYGRYTYHYKVFLPKWLADQHAEKYGSGFLRSKNPEPETCSLIRAVITHFSLTPLSQSHKWMSVLLPALPPLMSVQ
jgi:hypothetical protein